MRNIDPELVKALVFLSALILVFIGLPALIVWWVTRPDWWRWWPPSYRWEIDMPWYRRVYHRTRKRLCHESSPPRP